MSKWSIWGYIFIFIANFSGLLCIFLIHESHINVVSILGLVVMIVCFIIAISCFYKSSNSSHIELHHE